MINRFHRLSGKGGFALLTVLLLVLLVTTVAAYFIGNSKTSLIAARSWEASDQCLLDAQTGLERVKYEILQSYGSNTQPSASWFLSWTSNAIGSSPRYNVPSPVMVSGTVVYVTIAGVTVTTNFTTNLVNLDLVADARNDGLWPVRRVIQEQMQVTAGSNITLTIKANSAISACGSRGGWTVGGTLFVDGHNWSPPVNFNSGSGSLNAPSTNDMAGVRYNSASAPLVPGSRITIDGVPPRTNSLGVYDTSYWTQFVGALAPAASVYSGGSYNFGSRTNPVITIFSAGATTVASSRNGAGILIIPGGSTVRFNQAFYYEGIIILGSGATDSCSLTVNNTTVIYGGLVGLGSSGNFSVSVPGTLKVMYSKASIANLANITNLPSLSGTNSAGGESVTLKWRQLY